MGTHFGHPYKVFYSLMSVPIEKEHPMQILERIGSTVWSGTDRERKERGNIYLLHIYLYTYTYV